MRARTHAAQNTAAQSWGKLVTRRPFEARPTRLTPRADDVLMAQACPTSTPGPQARCVGWRAGDGGVAQWLASLSHRLSPSEAICGDLKVTELRRGNANRRIRQVPGLSGRAIEVVGGLDRHVFRGYRVWLSSTTPSMPASGSDASQQRGRWCPGGVLGRYLKSRCRVRRRGSNRNRPPQGRRKGVNPVAQQPRWRYRNSTPKSFPSAPPQSNGLLPINPTRSTRRSAVAVSNNLRPLARSLTSTSAAPRTNPGPCADRRQR